MRGSMANGQGHSSRIWLELRRGRSKGRGRQEQHPNAGGVFISPLNVPLINTWEAVPASSPFHSADLPLETKGNWN